MMAYKNILGFWISSAKKVCFLTPTASNNRLETLNSFKEIKNNIKNINNMYFLFAGNIIFINNEI